MKIYYESILPQKRDEVYFNNYVKFLEKRENRELDESIYTETHHIVPVSFFSKDVKYEDTLYKNMIVLTAEEHYIAHFLLYKAFKTRSTVSTLWLMNNRQKFKSVKMSSSEYAKFRINYSKVNSEKAKKTNKRMWSNPEYKEKMKKIFKENWTEERRIRASKQAKKNWENEEYRSTLHNSLINHRWMTKDGKNVLINKEEVKEYKDKGYNQGLVRTWNEGARESLIERRKKEKWVNNGVKNHHVNEEDLEKWLSKGYKIGFLRKMSEESKKAYSEKRKNMTLINDGSKDRRVDNSKLDEYLAKGFVIGSVRRGKHHKK